MKNLKDILEASILDVKGTMKAGDKYSEIYNEFNKLSEYVMVPKNWTKHNKDSFSIEINNVSNIIKEAGFTQAPEHLKLVIKFFKPVGTNITRGSISINFPDNSVIYESFLPASNETTLNNYLKKVISKYVLKDAKTFVNYIKYR